MPFTVSLGNNRWRNGLAPCAPFIPNGIWNNQPWEIRKEHCRACPYRFPHRPSCSMDFMGVGDTDTLKIQVAQALSWVASVDPDWSEMDKSVYEADLAYFYIGLKTPSPKAVLSAFIGSCANVEPDEQFWKDWNYHGVEHKDGKPALKLKIPGPMKEEVDKIVLNVIEPQSYSGKRLYHLYAAAAVLWEIGKLLDLKTMIEIYGHLVEACRRAIMANSTVDIS